MGLKLFVWEGNLGSLAQHEDGTAFALAEDLESAVELVVSRYWADAGRGETTPSTPHYKMTRELLRKELRTTKPLIVDSAAAFYIFGSA